MTAAKLQTARPARLRSLCLPLSLHVVLQHRTRRPAIGTLGKRGSWAVKRWLASRTAYVLCLVREISLSIPEVVPWYSQKVQLLPAA